MAVADLTISSPKPPSEVLAYMARFSNAAEWDPGVASAEELSPGPAALGSTYRLMVLFLGLRVPLVYKVTEFDPPHRVVVEAENSMVRSVDTMEVAPEGEGGSTLTYHATLILKGPAVVLSPIVIRAFKKTGSRAAEGLHAALGT